jgi:tRNA G18 (ribose-2'-O)-methylase SpoU
MTTEAVQTSLALTAAEAADAADAIVESARLDREDWSDPTKPPLRLRRAEAIIQQRTKSALLILERCVDTHNAQAALRTAEAFGLLDVWLVVPPGGRMKSKFGKENNVSSGVTKGLHTYLNIRLFETTAECVGALRTERPELQLWATALSPTAQVLSTVTSLDSPTHTGIALAMGREMTGLSDAMIAAADRVVYIRQCGFAESLNLSVAAALVMRHALSVLGDDACRGNLSEEEATSLRRRYFRALAHPAATDDEIELWVTSPPPPLSDLRKTDVTRNTYFVTKAKASKWAAGDELVDEEEEE